MLSASVKTNLRSLVVRRWNSSWTPLSWKEAVKQTIQFRSTRPRNGKWGTFCYGHGYVLSCTCAWVHASGSALIWKGCYHLPSVGCHSLWGTCSSTRGYSFFLYEAKLYIYIQINVYIYVNKLRLNSLTSHLIHSYCFIRLLEILLGWCCHLHNHQLIFEVANNPPSEDEKPIRHR